MIVSDDFERLCNPEARESVQSTIQETGHLRLMGDHDVQPANLAIRSMHA